MPTFALREVEINVRAVRRVFVLEVDGKSPYDDFVKRMIKAGNRKDLSKISILLDDYAMGKDLPPNANKPLNGVAQDDEWKEFELRKNQLRVYYFLVPPDDNIVVLGEFKKGNKGQRNTIEEFRQLKKAFKIFYNNTIKGEEE